MPYTTEPKSTRDENPDFKCHKCNSNNMEYRMWDSYDEAHTDIQYSCLECKVEWWVEGSDY